MTLFTGEGTDDLWKTEWQKRNPGQKWEEPDNDRHIPLERLFAQESFEDLKADMVSPTLLVNLPPEVVQYKDDIRRFVDAMVYKLRKNAHKGRWEGMTMETGLNLLREEVKELEQALDEKNTFEICTEAADVANFALILSAMAIDHG